VIYRDLKPENILLDPEGYVKLTDFGLSKILTDVDGSTSSFCGTVDYLAPEVICHLPYGTAVDWWALGVLVFELLYRRTPFANDNRTKMFQNICKQDVQFPTSADPDAVALIRGLLTKDPAQRMAFRQLKNHPFFRGLSFDDVLNKRIKPRFVPEVGNVRIPQHFDPQFTQEQALDSYVPPIDGPLLRISQFSFHRAEGLAAANLDEFQTIPEDPPPTSDEHF
jgi:serine/threonine protein kinase